MRVAIVTAFPEDPHRPRGGVEAVSTTLVDALRVLPDVDLHVLTVSSSVQRTTTTDWRGVPITVLPKTGRSALTSAVGSGRSAVHRWLRQLSPDVVHAHDTFGIMVHGLDVPRVLTIHGFIHEDTRVSGQRFARARALAWRVVETQTWAGFPHIIAISPYVRERLAGIARGVIHDLDNPIAADCFSIARRESPLLTVFSAAVISRRKNTLNLIEAVRLLRDQGLALQLRLAGATVEPRYRAAVDAAIAAHRLETVVEVLGPLNTMQIRNELGAADLFALVSLEENSPLAIEEAMAAGVPVVTSNRCGMPYMVRDGITGWLVDPEDPAAIADRLARVLQSADLRREMGVCARAVALERFHPERVAARTLDVYRHAAASHHRSPRDARSA
jgi:glycosyltransferase involved in cell wall biosynthesis